MSQQKFRIQLSEEETRRLRRIMTTGKQAARAITRARILLLADEGASDSTIADDVGGCLTTVFLTRRRYCQEGLDAVVMDRPRPGQPRTLSGHGEARLTALACSDPPEGHARWTMTLLADRLVELQVVEAISAATVQRTLKKTT